DGGAWAANRQPASGCEAGKAMPLAGWMLAFEPTEQINRADLGASLGSGVNDHPAMLSRDTSHMLLLDQLRCGQRACVERIQGSDAIVQRLYEMGLLEGEEIEVIGFAPLGDPMEIRLRDYRLSLRRSEAARICVRVLQ